MRYHRGQVRSNDLHAATREAQRAAQLARQRYRAGLIGYYEVLAAERDLIDTRDQWIQSRTTVVVGMVNLYRSLAGAPRLAVETPSG